MTSKKFSLFALGWWSLFFWLIPLVGWGATPKRIILLETISVPIVLDHTKWFLKQMGELGYEDGKTMELVLLRAEGDSQKAEALLQKSLKQGPVDLVVSNATLASKVAYKLLKGTQTPLLFFNVSSPIKAGLIQTIGTPSGTNVTGVVHTIPRNTKINLAFRMLSESIEQRPVRVGYVHSTYPSAIGEIEQLKEMAQNSPDYIFVPLEIEYKTGVGSVDWMKQKTVDGVQQLENEIDFWWQPFDAMAELFDYVQVVLDQSNKPILFGTSQNSVKLGALMHMTVNIESSGRETALVADKILNGKNPGEIPPTHPTGVAFGLNMKTALQLGLVIPSDILEMAGENIFR